MKLWHSAPCTSKFALKPAVQSFPCHPFPYWEVSRYLKGKNVRTCCITRIREWWNMLKGPGWESCSFLLPSKEQL